MKKIENLMVKGETKKGDCCPECDASWDGGDIYERYLKGKFDPADELHSYYKDYTLDQIKDTASSYGWSEENPTRFGKVIGVDMSMDLNATKEEQYDGVSYWQCPECEIAWNRFKGFRTDKFVKSPSASTLNALNKLKRGEHVEVIEDDVKDSVQEEEEKQIIYNAIKTPDGTIISSDHGHDYVVHEDKNGKTYGVDGGCNYLRRIGDLTDCEDLSMYLEPWTPEFHVKAREVVKRGGRGKDGEQPLTWVPICEMNDNWVLNTIDYNTERGKPAETNWFTNLLHEECHYRNANHIKIDE